jgi:hypothetical protein
VILFGEGFLEVLVEIEFSGFDLVEEIDFDTICILDLGYDLLMEMGKLLEESF